MADIRMPDGTIIRGIPDGVSKDEISAKLIKTYGQERYDQMTGATKAALSPSVDTSFADRVRKSSEPRDDPEGLQAHLDDVDAISAGPDRDAYIAKHGTAAKQKQDLMAQQGAPQNDPIKAKALRTKRMPSPLGGFLGMGTIEATPEDLIELEGEHMMRLIETGIRKPYNYKMTQEEYDAATQEKLTVGGMTSGEGDEGAIERDPMAGWGKWFLETVKKIPARVGKQVETVSDMHDRLDAQEVSLGQIYLQKLSEENTDVGTAAGEVIEQAAAKYGVTPEVYAKFVANTVDLMWDEENTSLEEFKAIQDEVAKYKPESAESGIGYFPGMFIENINNMAYIGVGVLTMNPITTLALMGTDVYSGTYANARLSGRTANEASMDSFASTAIEAVTEMIPVSKFISLRRAGGKSATRKFLEGLGNEAAQEILAEGAQIGYDIGVLDDEMGWGEITLRLRDAGVLGAMMGGVIAAPVAAFSDNNMNNAQTRISEAAKKLQFISLAMQNPSNKVDLKEIGKAKKEYRDAVQAKVKLIKAKKEAEAEKKKAKVEKKGEKRRKKMTKQEAKRDVAQSESAAADQSIQGQPSESDIKQADVLERAQAAELEEIDGDVVQELLDSGHMIITPAGTAMVLPAGKRRLKAIREAQESEIIEPTEYKSQKTKAKEDAVTEEIGTLMREDLPEIKIQPTKVTLAAHRRREVAKRVDEKVKGEDARNAIADAIIKAEEENDAYAEQADREQVALDANRDVSYDQQIMEQNEVESEVALNLSKLDQKSVSGYKGTRLGAVLRRAMKRLEREESKAKAALEDAFWNNPTQGTLFDITGVLAKGTKDYANLVRVGALKLTKTGLKYSAWAADMVGEFGDSIKPVLSRVFHDAKKAVTDIMKWSHEKFETGKRKGELKYSPKMYAKPGAIRGLRATLKKLAKEGEAGRFWYERTGKSILKLTGGNKAKARKLAGLLAIYSSGTGVGPNLTNALKMWAIYHGGDAASMSIAQLDKLADPNVPSKAMDPQQLDILERQIKAEGIQNPITIETKNGVPQIIADGNHRLVIMHRLGIKTAPVRLRSGEQVDAENALEERLLEQGRTDEEALLESQSPVELQVKKPKQGTMAGRFSEQDNTALDWLRSDATDEHFVQSFGDKRFPFFQNIMRAIDPALYEHGQGVTIDMWIMRVLGYDVITPSDAQFAFGTVEIKALADKLGWEKQQAQAAVWVAIKARWEFIQKKAKQAAVDQGLAEWNAGTKGKPVFDVIGKDRADQILNEKKIIMLFRKIALAESLGNLTKKLDESKRDFTDYLENHYATISWEAEPSTVLGLPFGSMSIEDKISMQYEMSQVLTNPKTGREWLAEWLDLLGQDQFQGPGAWDGSIGAVTQNSVLAPVKHKDSAKKIKSVQGEAADALNGYSAILGLLLKQDAVAWHKPFYSQSLKESNGVEIITNKPLSRAKTKKFYARIAKLAAEKGYDVGTNWAPIVLFGSVRVLNYEGIPNRDFHKIIEQAADESGINGDMEVFQSDGNLVSNDWVNYPQGEEYVQAISDNQNPAVQKAARRAQRELAKRVEAVYDKYAKKYGGVGGEATLQRVEKGRKLTKKPKGFLRFRHYSRVETDTLLVSKAGTGIRGAEAKRGSMKVISAYPNKGARKEQGLGSVEYVIDVPKERMYNANTDPLGLRGKGKLDMNAYEEAIRAAGFLGYYVPDATGNLKGQARFFKDVGITAPISRAMLSISERPVVQITENSFDQIEVRQKDGNIYVTDSFEAALRKARREYGSTATVELLDDEGSIITTDVFKSTDALILGGTSEAEAQLAAEEFYEDFLHSTEGNPLVPAQRIVNGKAAIELRSQDGIIWLDSIRAFETGKGHGSEGLKLVLELADRHGVVLKMTAHPFETGQEGMNIETLIEWYRQNGFEKKFTENMGVTSHLMVRQPRNAAVARPMISPHISPHRTNAGYGMEVDAIEAYVEEHFGAFYGLTNIVAVAAVEELPFTLYEQLRRSDGLTNTHGLFYEHPTDGATIYIIGNNIQITNVKSKHYGEGDLHKMVITVLHEVIGHFGLRAMLGPKGYNTTMDLVRKAFPERVKRQLKLYKMDPNNITDWRLAAEEVLAYLTEHIISGRDLKANQLSLLDRISNIINMKLAEWGIRKLSADDMAFLLLRSATFVKNTSEAQLKKRAKITTRMIDARWWSEAQKLDKIKRDVEATNELADQLEASGAFGPQSPKSVVSLTEYKRKVQQQHDDIIDEIRRKVSKELHEMDTAARISKVDPDSIHKIGERFFTRGPAIVGGRTMPGRVRLEIKGYDHVDDRGTVHYLVEQTFPDGHKGTVIVTNENLSFAEKQSGPKQFGPNRAMQSLGLSEQRRDDPDLDRFLNKISHGKGSIVGTLRDRWETMRYNMARRLEIEMLDKFAGIRHAEEDLKIMGADQSYVSVRLTAGVDVIIRSSLENGVPIWKDGTVAMDTDSMGLMEILSPIGQSKDMLKAFEMFIVARRARRLSKEQRENLFTRKEIGAAFRFIRKNKLHKLFSQTAKDMAAYKKRVLDFAQEAGVIDPVSRQVWENSDHVPFYRMLNNDQKGPFAGAKSGRFGANLRSAKRIIFRLEGGGENLAHPLESLVQNIGTLIEAAVKNQAATDVVNNFMGTGAITKAPQAEMTTALVPLRQIKDMLYEAGVSIDMVGANMLEGIQKLTALQAPTGENVMSIMVKGKRTYYHVHDKGIQRGLENITPTQWTWLMSALRFPKRVITMAITRMPDFILKNWFRDMWHAFILSRHGTVIPMIDSIQGWAKAIAENKTYKDMLSGGGVFDSGYVNASDPTKTHMAVRKALLGKGRHNILDTPRKLARFYMRIANGAENAHRIVVYEQALKKTGSRKQALFESRDLMDFSVRGANPVVRFLAETVPFWGARVQGLSRTGKGFKEHPYRTMMKALPIVLASIALYAVNRDDDRYERLSDFEKVMYYHFYDVFEDGDHYRLPKPFEVGALFSSIPEIIFEHTLSQEPDKGKTMGRALWWIVSEQLSLWPGVQAVKPIWELYSNYVPFTGAPVVGQWEDRGDPKLQYSDRTHITTKAIAQAMPEWAPDFMKSPKKLEHLLRGYFSSAFDYTVVATDMLYYKANHDLADPPEMRWDEMPFMKSFKREEYAKYDRYINSMYEVMEEADKWHNAINKLKKDQPVGFEDRIDEVRDIYAEELYARGPTNSAKKQVTKINNQISRVYADMDMTPEEKNLELKVLYKDRSDVAKEAYDYRPGGKLNEESNPDLILKQIIGMNKSEQVDALLKASLPHTATLINDITITDEKLKAVV